MKKLKSSNGFLKIHLNITQNKLMSFIEKAESVKKASYFEDCDPQCMHGVCKDSVCFCKQGYMGINCSIGISVDKNRVKA